MNEQKYAYLDLCIANWVTHKGFVCTLKYIANKVAGPSFHSLSANKAKVIHVPNTLQRDEQ